MFENIKKFERFLQFPRRKIRYFDVNSGDLGTDGIVDEVVIRLKDSPAKKPKTTIVMVHGWNGSAENWFPLVDELLNRMKSARIIIPDLIGHGKSSAFWSDDYSAESQVEMLCHLLDHIDVDKYVLMGISMGGLLVSLMANYDSRVEKLIIMDGIGFKKTPRTIPLHTRMARHFPIDLMVALLNGRTIIRKFLGRTLLYDISEYSEEYINETLRVSANYQFGCGLKRRLVVWKMTRQGLFKTFVDDFIGKIDVPTLLIWGENDVLVPVENGYLYRDSMKGAVLKTIPKCGHMPPIERPKETADVIFETGFLGD